LVIVMIVAAAILRIGPHPWNFTPVGAMAIFSGALIRDRRLAFGFPLLALFAGDCLIGFHPLMPVVYASFLINVGIGQWIAARRTASWIGAATLAGAIQFFVITNFAVWSWQESAYPKTGAGLVACYIAGIPFFWNTLAGDAFYAAVLFGGFAFAEHVIPVLREGSSRHAA
jgi:hypothetical protein